MLKKSSTRKNYFAVLLGIALVYLALIAALWGSLPQEIYLPLRLNFWREIGFYPKTISNVAYVFITPLVGIVIFQIVRALLVRSQIDLFSLAALVRLMDVGGLLFMLLGPAASLVCSFAQNGDLAYYFLALGAFVLVLEFLRFKATYLKNKEAEAK